ncbi:trypco2 family protein [Streptomyces rubiginosohelvolus]|uniref:trypco2 family protein n=1 Tax=Streptomyces rubiginosohelvolus TaxID=67362 RepID=UPI0033E3AB72
MSPSALPLPDSDRWPPEPEPASSATRTSCRRTDPDGAFGLCVGTVETESTLAVPREASASGGARDKVWVLPWLSAEASADGTRSQAHETTHRIKVSMESHNLEPVGA